MKSNTMWLFVYERVGTQKMKTKKTGLCAALTA